LCHLIGLVEFVGYVPWQQFLYAVDRMIGDALEHVLQITLWVDVI